MIAICIKTNRHSGAAEIVGVRTQRADIETWLAELGSDSGHVEIWNTNELEPEAVFYSLEEWGKE